MKYSPLTFLLFSLHLPSLVLALPLDLSTARLQTPGLTREQGRVVFSTNAQIGDYLKIADSNVYPIVVSASANPSANRWPQLALLVDGQPIQTVTVDSPEPRDYTLRANFTAGLHQLTFALVNATQNSPDFRLILLSTRIDTPAGSAEPSLAPLQDWRAEARRREAAALAHADEVIDRARKADAVVRVLDQAGHPLSNVTVQISQQRHAFLFGCNLFALDRQPSDAARQRYADAFTALFNYATLPFYWAYEPQLAGQPRESLVDFCRRNGLVMKGHPLLWNTPYGWPPGAPALPEPSQQRQRINDVLRQWSPVIRYWDLVNEPLTSPLSSPPSPASQSSATVPADTQPSAGASEGGTSAGGVTSGGGGASGEFRWAREVAPSAKLLVSDYNVLSLGSPPFMHFLRNSLRDGVPIDGVSLQAHEPQAMRYQLDHLQHILDRVAELGRPIQISELIIPSAGQPIVGSYLAGNWDEQRQAEYALQFYRLCFGHPAVTAISWCDLSDRGAWYPGGGLLREDLLPKPAYDALRKLIRQTWWTQTTATTGPDGTLAFRGFLGDYRLTVTINGQSVVRDVVLTSTANNDWTIDPNNLSTTQPSAPQTQTSRPSATTTHAD